MLFKFLAVEIKTENNLIFNFNFSDFKHLELFNEVLTLVDSIFFSQKSKPILTQFNESNNQSVEDEFKNLRIELIPKEMEFRTFAFFQEVFEEV